MSCVMIVIVKSMMMIIIYVMKIIYGFFRSSVSHIFSLHNRYMPIAIMPRPTGIRFTAISLLTSALGGPRSLPP